MKKIAIIIGGRPQIIKSYPLLLEIKKTRSIKPITLYSGQHYTKSLSHNLVRDLDLDNLDFVIDSKKKTGQELISLIIFEIDQIFTKLRPDATVVFGDMDTTLAGAIASIKKNIPVVHVEAGIRSFNVNMKEEQNRIITDHLSRILIVPNKIAVQNLNREGIVSSSNLKKSNSKIIIEAGDIMLESLLGITPPKLPDVKDLALLTIHRAQNTQSTKQIKKIINHVVKNTKADKIIFPVHPRTSKMLAGEILDKKIQMIAPLAYEKLIKILLQSKMVFTDSGGLQKEACWLGKPCVVLRDETEWPDLIEARRAVLMNDFSPAFKFNSSIETKNPYTASKIVQTIERYISS